MDIYSPSYSLHTFLYSRCTHHMTQVVPSRGPYIQLHNTTLVLVISFIIVHDYNPDKNELKISMYFPNSML